MVECRCCYLKLSTRVMRKIDLTAADVRSDYSSEIIRGGTLLLIVLSIFVIAWKGSLHERLFMALAKASAVETAEVGVQRIDPEGREESGEVSETGGDAESRPPDVKESEPDREVGVSEDSKGEKDRGVEVGVGESGEVSGNKWDGNEEVAKVYAFTESYPGGRIDRDYFALLYDACSGNYELLKTVVAVSVTETGMCRDGGWNANCWGWFKGGNRQYDPPREQMAQDICTGFRDGYPGGFVDNLAAVSLYTGNDRPDVWYGNFMSVYNSM